MHAVAPRLLCLVRVPLPLLRRGPISFCYGDLRLGRFRCARQRLCSLLHLVQLTLRVALVYDLGDDIGAYEDTTKWMRG